METNLVDLVLVLFDSVIVVNTVIDWLVVSTKWFSDLLHLRFTIRSVTFTILVFGLSSIYSTYSGVEISGAIVNARDLGPMIAGLVGGPMIGAAVGLIGGVHRYFLGGFTALSCSLATILSGVFAGLIYRANKGRFIGTTKAVAFAALAELFHMLLTLLLAQPFSDALLLVEEAVVPMVIVSCIGMLIFGIIVSDRIGKSEPQKQMDSDTHFSDNSPDKAC